ncbi:MAG TPA: hypothetical protein DCM05_13735 [Elusimicrobia bacterium]|nr:hypothetical protein [Elusimicrobiota bacterium]
MSMLLAALLPLLAAPPVQADDGRDVRVVVENTVNSVLDVLKDKSLAREAKRRKVKSLVEPVIDFALTGKLALGRTHWSKLSEGQRKEFTELFVKTLQDSYFEKLDLFTDEKVDFEAPAPAEKGKYQMMIRVLSKDQRYHLLYKLYKSGEAWKVYDVEIEGISIVRSYGSQYDQFLQKNSVADLLAKMKSKSIDAPKDLADQQREIKAREDAKPAELAISTAPAKAPAEVQVSTAPAQAPAEVQASTAPAQAQAQAPELPKTPQMFPTPAGTP